MKKFIMFSMMLLIAAHTFSQQATLPELDFMADDYLRKSKKQKKAATILMTGGVIFTATGFIISAGKASEAFNPWDLNNNPNAAPRSLEMNAGTLLGISGLAMMAGSIPLFIASSKNKKRALNTDLSFKTENSKVIQQGSFVQKSYPAVSVKLNLK